MMGVQEHPEYPLHTLLLDSRRDPNILAFSVFVLHCPTPRQRNALGYEQVCGMTR
jgi:hypothetical protein